MKLFLSVASSYSDSFYISFIFNPLEYYLLLTVTQQYQADFKIKGSKFVSFINSCDSTEEAESRLYEVRDLHPLATHHCYAYRVDPATVSEYSQDDGEPGGTAGLPILNAMRTANIVNTIVVVVRYYGGTKLGKRGLIEAYGKSADLVIDKATLKKVIATRRFEIIYSYDQQSIIDKLKHTFTLFEIDATYTEKVRLILECPSADEQPFERELNKFRHQFIHIEKKGIYSRVLAK